jgi:elongation factor G
VRVYAGCLRVGDAVLNATKGHNEQIGRLVRMFANHREDIRQIEAGMIGASVGAARSSRAPATRCAIRARRSCSIRSPCRTR